MFVIKGLIGVVSSFGAFDDIYPVSIGPNVWDFLMILFTEIGPTAVFIFFAKKNKDRVTIDREEEYETEMHTYSQADN